jgi:prephenate dehydrogenase
MRQVEEVGVEQPDARSSRRVAIIGLGLIGGSLGLALKSARLENVEVVGSDREWGVAPKAQRLGAIDRVARDAPSAARDAALVIIAAPILAIRQVMEEIAPVLPEGCVVTDTGSTKVDVMRWAGELLPEHVDFVGGHPMAGKEQSGIQAADGSLFAGAAYCVVPHVNASERAIKAVLTLASIAGARPVFIDAGEHDSYVAAVSHLPMVLSTALFSLARNSQAWPDMAELAGSGFRDLTRLASGDPSMSHDVCITNRDSILHWVDRMIGELSRYRGLIQDKDEELFKAFAASQLDREAFLSKPPERRPPVVEGEGDILSSGERMAAFLVGEKWVRRAKEVTQALEGGSKGREQERRRRRRP